MLGKFQGVRGRIVGMTQMGPMNKRQAMLMPTVPKGEIISTYDTYANAQHAVDILARANFPVNQVAIVGNDIRSVERVTGKMSYGKVAWMGALSGAYLGIFLALLLMVVQPGSQIGGIFLAAVAIGAGFGMLFGVLSYALNKQRRDFSSVMQLVAGRYDLLTDSDLLHEARKVLSSNG